MTRFLLLLIFLPPSGAAVITRPDRPEFAPVGTRVGEALVDWTAMTIRASAQARAVGGAHTDLMVVEDQARGRLGPLVLEASRAVVVDAGRTTGDIIGSGSRTGRYLDDQTARAWHVVEARYYTSGRIELDAELDMAGWLRPLLLAGARGAEGTPPQLEPTEHTGVVVDARGLDLEGALSPALWSTTGLRLYGLEMMDPRAARERTPVVWVSDPADPRAATRAGARPLLLRAAEIRDRVDVVLPDVEAARLAASSGIARLLSEGRVVLVADGVR